MDEGTTKACVGCGFCCRKAPCGAALAFGTLDKDNKCSVLRWNGSRYLCGFIINEHYAPIRERFYNELHIGAGCCAGLNTDRQNIPSPEACGLAEIQPPQVPTKKLVWAFAKGCGSAWVSGDCKVLIALALKEDCGKEIANEFLRACQESTAKHVKEFMG